MPKKKTNILLVRLACPECGRQNYFTTRNRVNTPDGLSLVKYCRWCQKRTPHVEKKK